MNGEIINRESSPLALLLNNISTFIFDVDGVLTNSNLIVNEDGTLLRTVNARDGFAIKVAIDNGYEVVIITGGSSHGVRLRFEALGVKYFYDGVKNKIEVLNQWLEQKKISPEAVLYMGDDLIDFECMNLVACPVAPRDAVDEIKQISKYISPVKGGNGCVRDVIEKTLKIQQKWNFTYFNFGV